METNQILNEIVVDLYNLPTKSCTIFKVTTVLSDSNPDAYKPQLVSIGPYHISNPKLHSMKSYKLRYLQRFLHRGIDLERCIKELEMVKDDALKCYDDIEDLYCDHNTGQFLKLLLLDGCFVVEFIQEQSRMPPDGERLIIKGRCMYNQVLRDMLLLENQLPFFVLTKLHDMTTMDQRPFIEMVKKTFKSSLPGMHSSSTEVDASNIKHFLHLVHMSCQPLGKNFCPKHRCVPEYNDQRRRDAKMPNATYLHEAGVRFSKDENICTSLFDVKFENTLITIPCIVLSETTETILRNLIAYEQLSFDGHPTYVTDFSIFMNYLIDSKKDVSLLRREGIIRNYIGKDKVVLTIFNKMGKEVSHSNKNFYYKDQCEKAVQYCEKPWNRKKASLMHNYFRNPRVGGSSVVAIILLILTFIKTVLRIFK